MRDEVRLTALSRPMALLTRSLRGPCHRPHAKCGWRIILTGSSARASLTGLQPVWSAMYDRRYERFRRATIDNKHRIGPHWPHNRFVRRWLTHV